jgi:hypothetical protein
MTEFVEDLVAYLSTAETRAGSRFYPNALPQGVTLPACRYLRVSNPVEHSHSGANSLTSPRFQFDCYAELYLDALILAREIVEAVDGHDGAMGDYTVEASFAEDVGRDDYDPETERHRVILDVVIWHRRS